MTGKLEVLTETNQDVTILRLKGEVDLDRAPALRASLVAAHERRPSKLVIDLSHVSYMDSSGVATLVEALQVTRREGRKLILCGLQERVRSIFEIARLDMVFEISKSVDDAER